VPYVAVTAREYVPTGVPELWTIGLPLLPPPQALNVRASKGIASVARRGLGFWRCGQFAIACTAHHANIRAHSQSWMGVFLRRIAGGRWTCGEVSLAAVVVTVTVKGEAFDPSLTVTTPLRGPTAVGEKVTLIAQSRH
jgi:hypothetical protein